MRAPPDSPDSAPDTIHEHPVLGFQMAGTCYAERSLPEMAGYASQMPKQNDGSLHSSSRLVRKDTCSAGGY